MTTGSEAVHKIVSAAGGKLVGKTRLQKTFYILELAGAGFEFPFTYHYYGPYSEDLASAAVDAQIDGLVEEVEDTAQWGGKYSVFVAHRPIEDNSDLGSVRRKIVQIASKADAVSLEIAATAALLKEEGVRDYWEETKRRKPQKARPEVVEAAKKLWQEFRLVDPPRALPEL